MLYFIPGDAVFCFCLYLFLVMLYFVSVDVRVKKISADKQWLNLTNYVWILTTRNCRASNAVLPFRCRWRLLLVEGMTTPVSVFATPQSFSLAVIGRLRTVQSCGRFGGSGWPQFSQPTGQSPRTRILPVTAGAAKTPVLNITKSFSVSKCLTL